MNVQLVPSTGASPPPPNPSFERTYADKPAPPAQLKPARVKLVVASFMRPIDLSNDWLVRLQRLNRAPDLR